MSHAFDTAARRAIRSALARSAYERDIVQVANPDIADFGWLVASHRGMFAVSETRTSTVLHGWFFGIERVDDHLFVYENCGLRDRTTDLGRIVRYRISVGQLCEPKVLVKGLHNNCHQLRMIDGLLCIVDTANQAIRRYTPDGVLIDVRTPFPVAPPSDDSGAYRHINSIAKVHGRIAIMCHNGKAVPEKSSELAWLDADWQVTDIETVPGHHCHDIVPDGRGRIWHCASAEGDIVASDGTRVHLSDRLMTRALAISDDRIIAGLTTFGPRQLRDTLNGGVVILDGQFNRICHHDLDGSPTDLVALP